MRTRSICRVLAVAVAVLIVGPAKSFAQLNGQNIKGDAGLKSGSQAPPGIYVAVPLYFYTADQIKDRDGNELRTGNLDAAVYGPALSVVTKRKIGGAYYGFLVALPWANNRVQGVEDFDSNPGAGITDMFIQPISLGWHNPRADTTVAYGLYLPTGRYEDGAANNTGLGMWAQEFLLGTTVYLNPQRTLHAATAATFDFQSEKKDSTTNEDAGSVRGDRVVANRWSAPRLHRRITRRLLDHSTHVAAAARRYPLMLPRRRDISQFRALTPSRQSDRATEPSRVVERIVICSSRLTRVIDRTNDTAQAGQDSCLFLAP